jgi:hypothetical protein
LSSFRPRMLMACLRYLAMCPCPRCLLLKSQIPMIGTKTDTKRRITLARVDNENCQEKIEVARKLMFEGGVNITSEKIERLLRPTSLVPTRVCFFYVSSILTKLNICRVLSRSGYFLMGSTSMRCLFQTCFMNSSWEYGRLYSHIFFASYMHSGKTRSRV